MTKPVEKVINEALSLPHDDRAKLAASLLASLDGPEDPDLETAWAAEIRRRIKEIDAGTVTLIPWEEVKRRIEEDVLGR